MIARETVQAEVFEKALLHVLGKIKEYDTTKSSHAFRAELKGFIEGVLGIMERKEKE